MIDIETIDKIYLYRGSTDLRKGMNALSYLVGELEKEDHLHKLFLNINKEQLTWLLLGLKVIKNPNQNK